MGPPAAAGIITALGLVPHPEGGHDAETWRGAPGPDGPQAVVPPGAWQAAESRGEWTLVSCVVAPGFEFSGFELQDVSDTS